MKQLNPKSHRITEANKERTEKRVETYYGKNDLLRTWELAEANVQIRNHDYLLGLKKRVRENKNYLLHRATQDSDLDKWENKFRKWDADNPPKSHLPG